MSTPADILALLLQSGNMNSLLGEPEDEALSLGGNTNIPVPSYEPNLQPEFSLPSPEVEVINSLLNQGAPAAPLYQQRKAAEAQPYGANVNGGADRVNANTAQTGIKAVVAADGSVTLTNMVGNTNQAIVKGGTSYTPDGIALDSNKQPMAPTADQKLMSNSVQGLLGVLRKTNNPDEARGIQSQIQESIAREQAAYYSKAQSFASNKIGIPMLEEQLNASMQQDSLVGPGAPPSPTTLKLRETINAARGQADNEAKRMMIGNVGYNSLVTAAKSAEAEAVRITKQGDYTARRAEMQLDRRENLQFQTELKEQSAAEGLTGEQIARAKMLHPELASSDDVAIFKTLKKHQGKDDGYLQVIDAPDSMLPNMAASGNSYAQAIVVAKEREAGIPEEVTMASLKELRRISNTPELLKKGMALVSGISPSDSKAMKEQQANLNALTAPGASKEKQKEAGEIRMQAARALLEQGSQNRFTSNVESWNINDPAMMEAINSAKNVSGKADMQSVLTSYLGDTTGVDRRMKIDLFTREAMNSAARTQKSQLGAIDPNKIKLVIQGAETRGMIDRIKDSLVGTVGASAASLAFVNPAYQFLGKSALNSVIASNSTKKESK